MKKAELLIRTRLDSKGFPETTVNTDNSNRIIVAIPDPSVSQETEQSLISAGKLEFLDVDGNVIMDGSFEHITGDYSQEEAENVAALINPGLIPFTLKTLEHNHIYG